ncbi:tail fiber protein [Rhizobium phage RHph_I40]|nr:tail fiber protein [Rhizobium phage RHph_I40]
MAYSRVTIPGDGVTTQITASFALGYINQSDVKIHVTGEVDGGGNIVYRTYSKISDTIYQVNGDPCPVDEFYVVERVVTKTELIVDWEDDEPITDVNLNLMQKQTIMIAQEAFDYGITALRTEDGSEGPTIEKGEDGQMVIWQGGNIKAGPNAQDIADAQLNAAAAAASAVAAANSASASSASATQSETYMNRSHDWASAPEDTPVLPGEFSAFHWARKAATYLASSFATAITSSAAKTDLVDADEFGIADSAAGFGMKKSTASTLAGYVAGKLGFDFFYGFIPAYVNATTISFSAGRGWMGGKYHETLVIAQDTITNFLDTGAIAANSTYFLYAIRQNNTGAVGFRISLSTTESGVVVPGGWTCHRGSRVGIILTNASSQVRNFHQVLNDCRLPSSAWYNTGSDVNALSLPPQSPVGISVDLHVTIDTTMATSGGDIVNIVASGYNSIFGSVAYQDVRCRSRTGTDTQSQAVSSGWARTNTSGQLWLYVDTSVGAGLSSAIGNTDGWRDYTCRRIGA